jgi:D-threo-aldose 1-dehydrogenase
MNWVQARAPVGHSTLRVPRLAFGTAPLATAPAWGPGEPVPEAQARETLRFAYGHGVSWFDTAPMYGLGLAETRTGAVLSTLPREQIVVATKAGYDISDGKLRRDYSRDGVMRSLEGSLKRLKVDVIDLLYVHDPDDYAQVVLDETFPALADLRAQGVVKAIGAGMNQWQVPLLFAQQADFDCFMIAGRWTLLEQGALPLLEVCEQKAIPVFTAGIYNTGILATGAANPNPRYNYGPAPAEIVERVRAIEEVCAAFHISLQAAATQYPFSHPAVKAIVAGFQSPAEVLACLGALVQPIPAAFWERLRSKGLLNPEAPLPSTKVNHDN